MGSKMTKHNSRVKGLREWRFRRACEGHRPSSANRLRYKLLRFVAPLATISLALVSIGTGAASAQDPVVPSRNSVDQRVEELLGKMTVEEKIGQLNLSFHFVHSPEIDQRIANGSIGTINHEFDPHEINRLQHLAVEKSRPHIPLLFMADVLHGYRVIFPVPLGLASSWDMQLIEDMHRRAALEARHNGQQWTASPMLDITRDPRWGRVVEGAGEDSYLGSKIAVAEVRGFQCSAGARSWTHIST
jgi:beta-glucosidase